MPVDSLTLRHTLRNWATGVTVVTSRYLQTYHGMTVNSFTSLSLAPPLVLVALEHETRTLSLVQASGIFGITILAEGQQEISNRFANPHMEAGYRFAGLETRVLETGAPFLEGGLAFIDCRVRATHLAGTHTMIVGEVVAAWHAEAGRPLLYFQQDYRRLEQGLGGSVSQEARSA